MNRRLGESQRQPGRSGDEKSLFTLPGFEPRTVQPIGYSQQDLRHHGSVTTRCRIKNLLQMNAQYPPEPDSITTTQETCYSETSKGTCDPTLCKNPEDHYLDFKDFQDSGLTLNAFVTCYFSSRIAIRYGLYNYNYNLALVRMFDRQNCRIVPKRIN